MYDHRFDRVLVPTDLSRAGKVALRWAAYLNETFGSRITLMYAHPSFVTPGLIDGAAVYSLDEPGLRLRITQELESYAADHLPAGSFDILIAEDAPAHGILEAARDRRAGMIVMSTHGRRGWRRALLGSVTEQVVHHADIPVLTVRPDEGRLPSIRQILCPVNFTPVGRYALERAAELAAAAGAALTVAHVSDPLEPEIDDVERYFSSWVDPDLRARCTFLEVRSRGGAADKLLELAGVRDVDLIVIGARRQRFSDATVLGDTTDRIIRFAERPVLVATLPHAPAAQEVRPFTSIAAS